jgi:hypothetical protein
MIFIFFFRFQYFILSLTLYNLIKGATQLETGEQLVYRNLLRHFLNAL